MRIAFEFTQQIREPLARARGLLEIVEGTDCLLHHHTIFNNNILGVEE